MIQKRAVKKRDPKARHPAWPGAHSAKENFANPKIKMICRVCRYLIQANRVHHQTRARCKRRLAACPYFAFFFILCTSPQHSLSQPSRWDPARRGNVPAQAAAGFQWFNKGIVAIPMYVPPILFERKWLKNWCLRVCKDCCGTSKSMKSGLPRSRWSGLDCKRKKS